ncbi:MAG: type II toxin-antitoxin system PemK/MazF family toxin [Balneolaceae bacterium]
MQKGDIVLIHFPFTDLTGSKKRPALILLSGSLDVTVSFMSTQLHWQEPTDLLLQPNTTNGLKKTSLVRIGKIASIDRALVIGKLGNIDDKEIEELDRKLIQIFDIKTD